MEKFRTVISLSEANFAINHQDKILCLGSCFASHIAKRLSYHKFRVTENPFGVLFHPIAIENLLRRVEEQRFFSESDFFFHNDLWHCYELHSDLSHLDLATAINLANKQIEVFKKSLQESDIFILTLGTVWVYEHTSGAVVANCHKVSQKNFFKRLLSVKEIEKILRNILLLAQKKNSNFHFIWSVSPVRHIKDGFVENNRSKAHLLAALHSFLEDNSQNNHYYFPAYEIMMDELRDYRFYDSDMIHPSEVAIDYVWNRFKQCFFNKETEQFCDKINKIQKSLLHKPFHFESQSHQKFLEKLEKQITELEQKYSYIRF